jgi:tryptophan synthase beta chain
MGLIMQEMSAERMIEVPEEVRDIYKLWRPTPLLRAARWEKSLDTPAKIYYKYEGASPAGSHKPNTAIAQAWYNKQEGITKLTTETGAGQWGSALSLACQLLDMECLVYMVKVSYDQKPYRRMLMEVYGANVISSPSNTTNCGRGVLAKDPDCSGSLGIAISEAVEDAAMREDTHYALGSVLNHVCLHQTIIGQEAILQMEMAEAEPDVVIACVGGGSNFGGFAFPFVHKNLTEGKKTRVIAVEPTSCPSLTRGMYAFDYGDTAAMAPVVKMYTLGHTFIPPGIHAGGLRYHGCAPLVSALVNRKIVRPVSVCQTDIFKSAILFAQTEGFIPAPETAHAVHAAVVEALAAKAKKKSKCIVVNYSGHGHFDLAAYDNYLAGHLKDYHYPREMIDKALDELKCIGIS